MPRKTRKPALPPSRARVGGQPVRAARGDASARAPEHRQRHRVHAAQPLGHQASHIVEIQRRGLDGGRPVALHHSGLRQRLHQPAVEAAGLGRQDDGANRNWPPCNTCLGQPSSAIDGAPGVAAAACWSARRARAPVRRESAAVARVWKQPRSRCDRRSGGGATCTARAARRCRPPCTGARRAGARCCLHPAWRSSAACGVADLAAMAWRVKPCRRQFCQDSALLSRVVRSLCSACSAGDSCTVDARWARSARILSAVFISIMASVIAASLR